MNVAPLECEPLGMEKKEKSQNLQSPGRTDATIIRNTSRLGAAGLGTGEVWVKKKKGAPDPKREPPSCASWLRLTFYPASPDALTRPA